MATNTFSTTWWWGSKGFQLIGKLACVQLLLIGKLPLRVFSQSLKFCRSLTLPLTGLPTHPPPASTKPAERGWCTESSENCLDDGTLDISAVNS